MERKVLGKGLEALIGRGGGSPPEKTASLDPRRITANRYQPRKKFRPEKLQDLVNSVREKGIVQPLIVRQGPDGSYELIAGERRLRAALELGLNEVPVVVRQASDLEMLELSLVENVQRDDINPLEEAAAYDSLIRDFSFTQEKVAEAVGKDRATIANRIRLLTLPEASRKALAADLITAGHAKAILALNDLEAQNELLNRILEEGWSVRQAEGFSVNVQPRTRESQPRPAPEDGQVRHLEDELQHIFGTKVKIFAGKKKGKINIEYYSLDDLDRILSLMRR